MPDDVPIAGGRTIRIGGTRLFERGSSAHIPPATAIVENARTYIAELACEGIRVTDVVAHVGVSRSLLDLRFRQVYGKSALEEILDMRLGGIVGIRRKYCCRATSPRKRSHMAN